MNKKPWIILLLLVLLYAGCGGKGTPQTEQTTEQPGPVSSSTQPMDTISTSSTTSSTSTTETTSTTSTTAAATTSTSLPSTSTTTTSSTTTTEVIKVEVVFFYPIGACDNCKMVGELTEETVNTYYLEEQSQGKLVYKVANLMDPSSKELLKKYGADTTSLWIGTYVNGSFHKELKGAVWYKTGDPDEYKRYLKESIDKNLKGDFS